MLSEADIVDPHAVDHLMASQLLPLSQNMMQSIFEYLPANDWLRVVGLLSKKQRELIEPLMTVSPHSDLRVSAPKDSLIIPRLFLHLITAFPQKTTLVINPIETMEQL